MKAKLNLRSFVLFILLISTNCAFAQSISDVFLIGDDGEPGDLACSIITNSSNAFDFSVTLEGSLVAQIKITGLFLNYQTLMANLMPQYN